jgi:hypothetical protein
MEKLKKKSKNYIIDFKNFSSEKKVLKSILKMDTFVEKDNLFIHLKEFMFLTIKSFYTESILQKKEI